MCYVHKRGKVEMRNSQTVLKRTSLNSSINEGLDFYSKKNSKIEPAASIKILKPGVQDLIKQRFEKNVSD